MLQKESRKQMSLAGHEGVGEQQRRVRPFGHDRGQRCREFGRIARPVITGSDAESLRRSSRGRKLVLLTCVLYCSACSRSGGGMATPSAAAVLWLMTRL